MINIILNFTISMNKILFKNKNWVNIVCLIVFLFLILPFIIFNGNSIITIHDNLDSNIPWYKYIRDNAYYLNINTASTTLDNISTLYFAGDFTYKGIVYYIFDTYVAYNIIYISGLIFAFFSMRFLLFLIFYDKRYNNLIKLVSLIYAILPVFPGYRISIATLPFGISLFYLVYKCNNKCLYIRYLIFSLIFPFFSCFENVLIFLLGYWFLAMIFLAIREKKINRNLFFCFVQICIGTVLANLRLFLMRLVYNVPLNRDIFNYKLISNVSFNLNNFVIKFLKFFIKGYYHAQSMHYIIILPLTIIFVFVLIAKLINIRNISFFYVIDYKLRVILVALSIITFNCIIIALSELQILYGIFKIIMPPLAGLSFTRLYIFNNVLWYIIFAAMLLYIADNLKVFNNIIIFLSIFIQIFIVIFFDNSYQDSFKSWKANLFNNDNYISYNEFYSKNLFENIKNDINYNGEICIAVGYHPSVLMYNGFNTADGYISIYPMQDALKFKELIQPELDINDWANRYYTSWWGRRYVYCKDLSYEPTRVKTDKSVTLRIDVNYYKEYYNGKYVISRAELSNYNELGLEFVNNYVDDNSIYDLWVYKT